MNIHIEDRATTGQKSDFNEYMGIEGIPIADRGLFSRRESIDSFSRVLPPGEQIGIPKAPVEEK